VLLADFTDLLSFEAPWGCFLVSAEDALRLRRLDTSIKTLANNDVLFCRFDHLDVAFFAELDKAGFAAKVSVAIYM